jgi:hypothetical protein
MRLIALLGVTVIIILMTGILYLRGRRTYVTLRVRNESGEIVRSAHIRGFSLCPRDTDLGQIAPGESVTIRLTASGYSGYSITPTFNSGRTFTSEGREALGGYHMTERINSVESIVEWDRLSTIYERSFQSRYGWLLAPIYTIE